MLTLVRRSDPRAPGRHDPLLALTAEALFGAQLVVRHRAPRVALAIASGVAVLLAAARAWTPPDPAAIPRAMALAVALGASVSAVAGTRLLAPGAALHSARYAATSANRAIVGRAIGAAGVLVVPVTGLLLVLVPHDVNASVLAAGVAAQGAALLAGAGATPWLGVMPGGTLCVAGSLLVVMRPEAVFAPGWLVGCAALTICGGLVARAAIVGRSR